MGGNGLGIIYKIKFGGRVPWDSRDLAPGRIPYSHKVPVVESKDAYAYSACSRVLFPGSACDGSVGIVIPGIFAGFGPGSVAFGELISRMLPGV